ncbi:GNAT family N-acetyltransferase [Cohnella sp. AR92]|uniref:GNAT family N-acetyltransferase n=1 Tax=Cohnella sp. AR92 TaxID=648716 RepID=UPI000F8E0DB1|nr:GNAT family N-acetyltransferase [Cohnella sp. AR92]RUS48977.1 GNAT family N-acetyltransferase [Cohnella sp. AR92]
MSNTKKTTKTTVIPMLYDSREHLSAIARLEEECRRLDPVPYRAGIEHLAKENGDRGVLCFRDNELIGLLSWHTPDGETAKVDARVHPHYRRQGVFRSLLRHAAEEVAALGIRQFSFRVPKLSDAGIAAANALGAAYDRTEFAMTLRRNSMDSRVDSDIRLIPEQPEDDEFMIDCMVQAFGDDENWTRDYLALTRREPSRTTYIAWADGQRVGMIRVNAAGERIAAIHDFCILPAYQGRKLGTQALQAVVSLLLADSFADIRLGVVTDNERALSLYLKSGFEVTAENRYYLGKLS